MGAALKALFVSYDGALDPLGGSQVVPYVVGLSERGVSMTLVSFEKAAAWERAAERVALAERLRAAGVVWRALRYHKRPRVPATLWDVAAGARAIGRAAREGVRIVHCRGDVAMTMARLAALPEDVKILYDVRGLFADERVEAGSWRAGGALDRAVRRQETANLARAGALVVLTHPALEILAKHRGVLPPHAIIPTCVDTRRFAPQASAARDYALAYVGSLGTWYMLPEMVAFARIAAERLGGRVLFLTPDGGRARAAGADPAWCDVERAAHDDVPRWLARARASFFFITPSPAKRASCPTKLGEALACGLPVVANAGVGDHDALLAASRTGVSLTAFSTDDYRRAADALARLLEDPETRHRCRRLAEERFGLEAGVTAYHGLYHVLGQRGGGV